MKSRRRRKTYARSNLADGVNNKEGRIPARPARLTPCKAIKAKGGVSTQRRMGSLTALQPRRRGAPGWRAEKKTGGDIKKCLTSTPTTPRRRGGGERSASTGTGRNKEEVTFQTDANQRKGIRTAFGGGYQTRKDNLFHLLSNKDWSFGQPIVVAFRPRSKASAVGLPRMFRQRQILKVL